HQCVSAHQDAHRPDGEQQRRDHQVPGDGRLHDTGSSSGASWAPPPSGSPPAPFEPAGTAWRRPSSMTPMAATISRTEVTSKGKKYELNRTSARTFTLPVPWLSVDVTA